MGVREMCLKLATFGSVGRLPGGSIIASVYALGFIAIERLLYLLSPSVAQFLFLGVIAISLLIIQIALSMISEYDVSVIVLDKAVGTLLVFAGIPFAWQQWKILLAGFILFHLLFLVKSFILFNEQLRKIEQLPGVLGIVVVDCMFGIIVNVFLHVGIWFFY